MCSCYSLPDHRKSFPSFHHTGPGPDPGRVGPTRLPDFPQHQPARIPCLVDRLMYDDDDDGERMMCGTSLECRGGSCGQGQ